MSTESANASTSLDRFSVLQLREYWDAVAALKDGESIRAMHPCQMPPWKDICNQLHWRLHRADGGYFSEKHHGSCGVYRLVALESNGKLTAPASLNRLCGQDPTGTLYIGCASRLHSRLNQVRRSVRAYRAEGSHGAVAALRALPGVSLPPTKLAIALLFTERCIRSIEDDLIRAYMNTYGDAPPLNYRL
jgi:hypothetical protein